ncbi:MAG: FAD-dependent oxidoreductase, partial [Candidatus Cloacimonetes bacterium]|nr:FAD-dependent oxidoreductase [Candidatus Cloacimonadota bacterium]
HSPAILNENFSLKHDPDVFLAGQISGVEGYLESVWSGLITARCLSENLQMLPEESMSGQIWRFLLRPGQNFQPVNANFGLLPPLDRIIRDKKAKKAELSERALTSLRKFIQ